MQLGRHASWALIALLWGTATAPRADAAPDPDAPVARPDTHGPRPDPRHPRGVPSQLDTSRVRLSDAGHFQASLGRPGRRVPLNEIHAWTLELRDPQGRPVEAARVELAGGMPAHDHGFPTRPRVDASGRPGEYRVDGVKFNMTGWWEFVLSIRTPDARDVVRFNIVVEP